MSSYYGKTQASKMLGMSEATLWNLKNICELDPGKHWLYSTGKKASTPTKLSMEINLIF